MFSFGRQFQAATVKPGWMESAMVPMAFITFAMFLMDIMQRMFPYYGGGSGWSKTNDGEHYDHYNNVKMPTTTVDDSTSIKFSSLFGRSNIYEDNHIGHSNRNVYRQRRPAFNKFSKNGRRVPQRNPKQEQFNQVVPNRNEGYMDSNIYSHLDDGNIPQTELTPSLSDT